MITCDLFMSTCNIIMLHVDIIYLTCRGQKYATYELGEIMIMIELMNQYKTRFARLTCNYISHQSDEDFIKPKINFHTKHATNLLVGFPSETLSYIKATINLSKPSFLFSQFVKDWLLDGFPFIGDRLLVDRACIAGNIYSLSYIILHHRDVIPIDTLYYL